MVHQPHQEHKLEQDLIKIQQIIKIRAVSACSPPDSKFKFCNFFPGGLANISNPA